MKATFENIAVVATLLLLAGCASPVHKIDITAQQLASVNTLTVIRPPETKTYTVLNIGHPGMAFGLIGGLIAAGDQSSKQDKLTKAYLEQRVAIPEVLAQAVADQLNQLGFKAVVKDGPWEDTDNGRKQLKFEKIQADTDGVIVLSPTVIGFVSPQSSTQYLPTAAVIVSLLASDRKTVLYRGFHASGWEPKAEGWRTSPPAVTFGNFDALISDTKASAASLEVAAKAVAISIAKDLRRQ